jgi:hypothetical protein
MQGRTIPSGGSTLVLAPACRPSTTSDWTTTKPRQPLPERPAIRWFVAHWQEFGKVLEELLASVPGDADVQAVGFDEGRQPPRVELWTGTPGAIIGRRDATADAIRLALSQRLGRDTQLNIREQSLGEPPP